jgi:hypothetical protein
MREENLIHLNDDEMRQKINLETAQIEWGELQREFARGVVVVVGKDLDLVDVAMVLNKDDTARFEAWVRENKIHRALDDDAKRWNETKPVFWSVVVAPWVLVQEIVKH